jgi:hypothetical protein
MEPDLWIDGRRFKQLTPSIWLIPGENSGNFGFYHKYRVGIYERHQCIRGWQREISNND